MTINIILCLLSDHVPCYSCTVKICLFPNKILFKPTKALPRLCRTFHIKMTGTSCTDDARVKGILISKSHIFLQYEISTETLSIYIFVFEDVTDCCYFKANRLINVLLH